MLTRYANYNVLRVGAPSRGDRVLLRNNAWLFAARRNEAGETMLGMHA